jgi:hypothetical protein
LPSSKSFLEGLYREWNSEDEEGEVEDVAEVRENEIAVGSSFEGMSL